MSPSADTNSPNAIGRALELLGDEWTLLIVRCALTGVSRYSEVKASLGISDAVLSSRLTRLVDAGLLVARPYCQRPVRHEYVLTPSGADLWALLVSIWAWEAAWVKEHSEPLPLLRHAAPTRASGAPGPAGLGCGQLCTPQLICAACGADVTSEDVLLRAGPAGSARRAVPQGSTRRRPRPAGTRTSGAGLFPETMQLLGNRWSAAMLGASFLGVGRFTDLQELLGAPPATVSDRLRSLTEIGVVLAGAQGYRLTEKGRATFGIVAHLVTWAETRLPVPEGLALTATHIGCGRPFAAALACSACHGRLARAAISVEGDGAAAHRLGTG
jgi:DNA-binding HxlR family transcriptional regulator